MWDPFGYYTLSLANPHHVFKSNKISKEMNIPTSPEMSEHERQLNLAYAKRMWKKWLGPIFDNLSVRLRKDLVGLMLRAIAAKRELLHAQEYYIFVFDTFTCFLSNTYKLENPSQYMVNVTTPTDIMVSASLLKEEWGDEKDDKSYPSKNKETELRRKISQYSTHMEHVKVQYADLRSHISEVSKTLQEKHKAHQYLLKQARQRTHYQQYQPYQQHGDGERKINFEFKWNGIE